MYLRLMRSRMAPCAVVVAILFATLQDCATAQGSFTIRLRQPPPNLLRLTDLWEVDIINPGQTPLTVSLFATVRQGNEGTILNSTTSSFSLPPGMKSINVATSGQLSPISNQFLVSRYRDALNKTSQFPSGDYTVCVTLRVPSAARPVDIATDCIDQPVRVTSGPILISPVNESTVQEPLPVLTWAWPGQMQGDRGTTFTLRIVEILGRQSPDAAIDRNKSWYERDLISFTSYQYPVAARAFQSGHRYAWTVYAFSSGLLVAQSEVWEFTYEPPSAKKPMQAVAPVTLQKFDILEELLRSCSEGTTN